MVYVHGEYIQNKIDEYGKAPSKGKNKNIVNNPAMANAFTLLQQNEYMPMRSAVENMVYNSNNTASFQPCADILNAYYDKLKQFMKANNISTNSKLHTNFLEEFSIYFLKSLLPNYFDIFNKNIFAGLKIDTNQNISQIKKDVDFCIGKELNVNIGGDVQSNVIVNGTSVNSAVVGGENDIFRFPAISVEVKTYVDATMLGEVLNTSRKIKGANPGSKTILLTWCLTFKDEHLYEAAYDSYLDEIVVLGTKKRNNNNDVVEFTSKGLQDYYIVMEKAIKDVTQKPNLQTLGRMLAYVRQMI